MGDVAKDLRAWEDEAGMTCQERSHGKDKVGGRPARGVAERLRGKREREGSRGPEGKEKRCEERETGGQNRVDACRCQKDFKKWEMWHSREGEGKDKCQRGKGVG
ncbi:hypothetical protein AMTR_s00156p00041430 [Amborella trichopoda]|uniref:Uncharacterized protein n=1 Tax=Amborella trichopoda TaxID=13333 RepID=W1PED2_AMBTC|nr:hypothetical protein AMTR_s00156p00041430 [Amborella trichopoda]